MKNYLYTKLANTFMWLAGTCAGISTWFNDRTLNFLFGGQKPNGYIYNMSATQTQIRRVIH